MANLFGNLKTEGLEEQGDRLGGVTLFESDIYDTTIKMAYVTTAQSGAMAVNFSFDINGVEYRETIYVTNKNGENFYLDKQDSTKKHILPGYQMADSVCLMATGIPMNEQDMQDKVVKVYDFDAKAEINKNVPTLVDLIGKEVTLAILKITQDKTLKNAQTGIYEPTGSTQDVNQIDKAFHTESKRTKTEVLSDVEEPVFYQKWLDKNQGKTPNRAKGVGGQGGAKTGTPGSNNPPAGGTQRPAGTSLFGKKK